MAEGDPLISCPYDNVHQILKSRMQFHLVRCRKNYTDLEMVECPFDATHIISQPEFEYHLSVCESSSNFLNHKYSVGEQSNTRILPVEGVHNVPLPPVAEDWDQESTSHGSYDPQQHVENKNVIRCLIGASKAKRKQFRQSERLRLEALERAPQLAISKPQKVPEMVSVKPLRAPHHHPKALSLNSSFTYGEVNSGTPLIRRENAAMQKPSMQTSMSVTDLTESTHKTKVHSLSTVSLNEAMGSEPERIIQSNNKLDRPLSFEGSRIIPSDNQLDEEIGFKRVTNIKKSSQSSNPSTQREMFSTATAESTRQDYKSKVQNRSCVSLDKAIAFKPMSDIQRTDDVNLSYGTTFKGNVVPSATVKNNSPDAPNISSQTSLFDRAELNAAKPRKPAPYNNDVTLKTSVNEISSRFAVLSDSVEKSISDETFRLDQEISGYLQSTSRTSFDIALEEALKGANFTDSNNETACSKPNPRCAANFPKHNKNTATIQRQAPEQRFRQTSFGPSRSVRGRGIGSCESLDTYFKSKREVGKIQNHQMNSSAVFPSAANSDYRSYSGNLPRGLPGSDIPTESTSGYPGEQSGSNEPRPCLSIPNAATEFPEQSDEESEDYGNSSDLYASTEVGDSYDYYASDVERSTTDVEEISCEMNALEIGSASIPNAMPRAEDQNRFYHGKASQYVDDSLKDDFDSMNGPFHLSFRGRAKINASKFHPQSN